MPKGRAAVKEHAGLWERWRNPAVLHTQRTERMATIERIKIRYE